MPNQRPVPPSAGTQAQQDIENNVRMAATTFGRAWTLDTYLRAFKSACAEYERTPNFTNLNSLTTLAQLYKLARDISDSGEGPA